MRPRRPGRRGSAGGSRVKPPAARATLPRPAADPGQWTGAGQAERARLNRSFAGAAARYARRPRTCRSGPLRTPVALAEPVAHGVENAAAPVSLLRLALPDRRIRLGRTPAFGLGFAGRLDVGGIAEAVKLGDHLDENRHQRLQLLNHLGEHRTDGVVTAHFDDQVTEHRGRLAMLLDKSSEASFDRGGNAVSGARETLSDDGTDIIRGKGPGLLRLTPGWRLRVR